MLNVPDALFVSPLFFIFMLPIAIADVGSTVTQYGSTVYIGMAMGGSAL